MTSKDDMDNIINIEQTVELDRIEILKKDGNIATVPRASIVHMQIDKSANTYVDTCLCVFVDKSHDVSWTFGVNSEVKIFASSAKEQPIVELFSGYVKKKLRRWQDKEEIVEFIGYSFAAILSKSALKSWQGRYDKGFGEIIVKLVRPFSFKVQSSFDKPKAGSVYFDNISILDAIRHLAYVKGWCLKFEGKTITFSPCKPPEHTGVTINMQDCPSGTIIEE